MPGGLYRVVRGPVIRQRWRPNLDQNLGQYLGRYWSRSPRVRNFMHLCVLVCLSLVLVQPAMSLGASPSGRAVVVLPFDSLSRYASHNWMRTAIPEVLASRLTGAGQLRVLEGSRAAEALRAGGLQVPDVVSLEAAMAAGRAVGADVVIYGSVDKRQNQLVVQANLGRVSDGKVLNQVALSGDFEAPWDALNELSRQILLKLGSTPTRSQEPRLVQQAARDRYSLTLFGRGVGQLYGVSGPVDLPGSEENLRRALRIDPNNPLFYCLFGLNQLQQKQDSDASAAFFEALKYWSDYPQVRRYMARLSETDNHLDDAIGHLQSVIVVEPSDMQAHFDLGRLLAELDRKGASLDEVTLVAKSDAPAALKVPALKLQAQLRAGLGDVNGMGDSFKALLVLAPNDAEARIGLAAFHMRRGSWAEAETHFKALATQNPTDPVPVHYLGEIALQKGELDAAVAAFKAEGALRPTHPTAWSYLGEAYRRAKNGAREVDAEGMAQVRDKKNPVPLNNLAVARYKEGDPHTALILLKQAIEVSPGWGLLHQNMGIVLAGMSQDAKAMESLQTALQLTPKLPAAHYQLGLLKVKAGDLRGAAASLEAACDSDPGLAAAFYNLGRVKEAIGDRSGAAKALTAYLQLSPRATDAEDVKARIARLK